MLILSRHGLELAFKSRDRKVVCFQVPLSKFFLVYGSMRGFIVEVVRERQKLVKRFDYWLNAINFCPDLQWEVA